MTRHRYRHVPRRRNPSGMAGAAVPIALVAAGLYLLHKGSTVAATVPSAPVNGLGGLLGQLGFSFSNFLQTAGTGIKESIVAPLQVAARVAVAPVKLSTGSSWSSVVSSIKAPVQSAAAAVRAASPGHIMGKGGTSSSTNGSTTQYYDAQNNVITQNQYNALQQAVTAGQTVGPVTDASGTWYALPTGVTTTDPTVAAQYGLQAPSASISNTASAVTTSPVTGGTITTTGTQQSIASYYDPNGQVITLAQYDAEMAAIGYAPSTAISGQIQVPQPTSAAQASSIALAAQTSGAPLYTSAAYPTSAALTYKDPNGNTITLAQYTAEMASIGLPASLATTGIVQVPAPTSVAQAQALSNAAASTGAPYINPTTIGTNSASGVPTYWDPNGNPISYAHYEYELSSGMNPTVIQSTALTAAQQQALLNQTNSGGDQWQPPNTAASGASMSAAGGGGDGYGQSFTDPNTGSQGTSYPGGPQDPNAGGPQPDPNAPAGVPVATASPTNWFAVGGAVVAVPIIMHFMNK
jgi:hypothetical protein